jgi:hypothetical protein
MTANIFTDIFGDSVLNIVYALALFIGTIYAIFLVFFQGIGDALGDLDIDLDFDADLDVDTDAASEAAGISVLAIASFISSFGAFGLIAVTLFDAGSIASLIVALLGGIVIGIAAQFFFLYILSPTISSEVQQTKLIGMVAEITTPIPANGVGQIAFVAKGSRVTCSARATEGALSMTRGTAVRIERIVGGMAYVSEIP